MVLKHVEPLLDEFLCRIVANFGYSRRVRLYYTRPVNEAIAKIAFGCRFDARGFVAFTCGVGVFHEALDRWLRDDPSNSMSTLGTPIHLLREDRKFSEWIFKTPEQLLALRDPIVADLTKYAVPFVEKYSHLDEVVKAVSSSNPKDWFNWNIHSRINFLAVVRLVEGDKDGALKLLDDALIDQTRVRRSDRFDIEYLRRRIVEQG